MIPVLASTPLSPLLKPAPRSHALKVITSLISPLKSSAGVNAIRVSLSAFRTRADISDTAPTSVQLVPLSIEKYSVPPLRLTSVIAIPGNSPSASL